jgi:hypothetical protein
MASLFRSPRWQRALADTKGFQEWRRNALIALLPAVIQFAWERQRDPRSTEPIRDFIEALVTFGVVFILIPFAELLWNLHNYSRKKAEADAARFKAESERLQGQLDVVAQTLPRAVARFTTSLFSEVLLEVVNEGAAGDFWEALSINGALENVECVRVAQGPTGSYVPKGGRFAVRVARLQSMSNVPRARVVWSVIYRHAKVAIKTWQSHAFGSKETVEFLIEVAIMTKPDMAEGILRKRLRISGWHATDEETGEGII